jgi:hypothetical protein
MNANKEEETRRKYRENVERKKEMTTHYRKQEREKQRENEGRKWWSQKRMIKEQNKGKHTKPI